jgi:hypothetical protein
VESLTEARDESEDTTYISWVLPTGVVSAIEFSRSFQTPTTAGGLSRTDGVIVAISREISPASFTTGETYMPRNNTRIAPGGEFYGINPGVVWRAWLSLEFGAVHRADDYRRHYRPGARRRFDRHLLTAATILGRNGSSP